MTDIPTRLEIRRQRRADRKKHGELYQALDAAWRERQEMKRQGVPEDDLNRGFKEVLRDVYPQQRERPWEINCDDCQDTGMRRRWVSEWRGKPLSEPVEVRDVGCDCSKGRARRAGPDPADIAATVAERW